VSRRQPNKRKTSLARFSANWLVVRVMQSRQPDQGRTSMEAAIVIGSHIGHEEEYEWLWSASQPSVIGSKRSLRWFPPSPRLHSTSFVTKESMAMICRHLDLVIGRKSFYIADLDLKTRISYAFVHGVFSCSCRGLWSRS
ncbi:unnamed protein product, partial [Scytosiphon promiscuus]